MADVDLSDAPKRCTHHQPPLAEAINRLTLEPADVGVKPHLERLAADLRFRTAHCPDAVTATAVRDSLQTVLGHMIDAVPFRRRHEVAFGYFEQRG